MGMDVIGLRPTSKVGAYFRRNNWGWRPLAELVCKLAPAITRKCTYWQSNDGDGLDAARSKKLAQVLRKSLKNGTVAEAIAKRSAKLKALPDETCDWCHGSGVRRDNVGQEQGQTTRLIEESGHPRQGQRGWCNGCDGRGSVRPSATWYDLSLESVREFADFLDACGGFEIC